VIVRRGLNFTNGATIPVLAFTAAEAVAPASNTVSITGLVASESNFLDVYFQTPTLFGAILRGHSLYGAAFFTSGTQAIYGVPSTLTQSGDLHSLDIYAEASDGSSYRGHKQFYRNPSDKTAALGASLSTPVVGSIATTPSVRLRATLSAQADYNSFVNVFYIQGNSTRTASVTATAGYFGTVTNWVVDMPDLSGVTGFSSSFGLQSNQVTTWIMEAYGGPFSAYIGGPSDGSTLKYAGRISDVATMQQLRASEGSPRHRRVLRAPFAVNRAGDRR
jgi:hypothetical protein